MISYEEPLFPCRRKVDKFSVACMLVVRVFIVSAVFEMREQC